MSWRPLLETVIECPYRERSVSPIKSVLGSFERPCSLTGNSLEGTSPVRLIYLDESGLAKERFLVEAGVIVEADAPYAAVAEYLKALIAEFIPEEQRFRFAFHATKIFSGKKPYDKFSLEKRIEMLSRILEIPGRFQLPVVYGYLDKHAPLKGLTEAEERLVNTTSNNHGLAFMMCALAAERYMKKYARAEELATMHAENNHETHTMLRALRRSLAGRSEYDIRPFLGSEANKMLYMTRVVDEISFHEKDDSFDAGSGRLRLSASGRL